MLNILALLVMKNGNGMRPKSLLISLHALIAAPQNSMFHRFSDLLRIRLRATESQHWSRAHRIPDTSVGWHLLLWSLEGVGHTFGGKEAIAESDDTHSLRFQHSVDFGKNFHRLLKILDADATEHVIERSICCCPVTWVSI